MESLSPALTTTNFDGTLSALSGNGEICTTLGPTGFHEHRRDRDCRAHRTQEFVWAGRRRRGPRHRLISFGRISRTLRIDGEEGSPAHWEQRIDWAGGRILSRLRHPTGVQERVRSGVLLADNAFVAEVEVRNVGSTPHAVELRVTYRFEEAAANGRLEASTAPDAVLLTYEVEEHLGDIVFGANVADGDAAFVLGGTADGATAVVKARVEPEQALRLQVWVQWSDRAHYAFPLEVAGVRLALERHEKAWRDFWSRSEVVTGDPEVDAFRWSGLYTLRCQCTPWSTPPTLSEPYWGGGAFHDELYPMLGLLAHNHGDLSERAPRFRLATLPRAMRRARMRGALYPWSSTEDGEERDPNGLWLTERFHLGQFAVCIEALWRYARDPEQAEELYPVVREVARHFEMDVVERDANGAAGTRECVDFDESVGAVRNGVFTLSAAIASLEIAAGFAERLGVDASRVGRWRALASDLRRRLPLDRGGEVTMPGGKPLHYAVLGPVFPFEVDVRSAAAAATAAHIHEACRSAAGWKPGFSEVYEGSAWMWTAGHLAIVHALQGNAEKAWEALVSGPRTAGPFLSPNEHLDRLGAVQVPWFTTGVGGWLYAMATLVVQVDALGTILLPAVPAHLPRLTFRDLRASHGVLVSGEIAFGRIVRLGARCERTCVWRFRAPEHHLRDIALDPSRVADGWAHYDNVELDSSDRRLERRPESRRR